MQQTMKKTKFLSTSKLVKISILSAIDINISIYPIAESIDIFTNFY